MGKSYTNVRDHYFGYYPILFFIYFRKQDYSLIKSKLVGGEAMFYPRSTRTPLVPKSRQGSNTNEPKPVRLLNHRQRGADSVKLRKHCLTELSSAHVYIQRQSYALQPGKQGYFSYPGQRCFRVLESQRQEHTNKNATACPA